MAQPPRLCEIIGSWGKLFVPDDFMGPPRGVVPEEAGAAPAEFLAAGFGGRLRRRGPPAPPAAKAASAAAAVASANDGPLGASRGGAEDRERERGPPAGTAPAPPATPPGGTSGGRIGGGALAAPFLPLPATGGRAARAGGVLLAALSALLPGVCDGAAAGWSAAACPGGA